MKGKLVRVGILAVVLLSALFVFPQKAEAALCGANSNMYRSAASGNWAANATWEVSTDGGTNWGAAGCWPSSSNGTIQIRNGHTVTVTAGITVDQVTIDAGGQVTVNSGQTWTINDGTANPDLTVNGTIVNSGTMGDAGDAQLAFNSGSVYRHAQNGGAIPSTAAYGTVTWNAASTVEVTGVTNAPPSGLGQSFGNFTWNCTGQSSSESLAGDLDTINGNFTIVSTGGGASELQLINSSSSNQTLTIGGNLVVQGGNLDLFNGNDNNFMTVNIGGSYIQTGGTVTSGNTQTASVISFTGASSQFTQSGGTFTTTMINFNVFGAGDILTLNNNLTVATGRTFTVNNGATLYTGTNIISGTGTFTRRLELPQRQLRVETFRRLRVTSTLEQTTRTTVLLLKLLVMVSLQPSTISLSTTRTMSRCRKTQPWAVRSRSPPAT
jgi:hypothetical protein